MMKLLTNFTKFIFALGFFLLLNTDSHTLASTHIYIPLDPRWSDANTYEQPPLGIADAIPLASVYGAERGEYSVDSYAGPGLGGCGGIASCVFRTAFIPPTDTTQATASLQFHLIYSLDWGCLSIPPIGYAATDIDAYVTFKVIDVNQGSEALGTEHKYVDVYIPLGGSGGQSEYKSYDHSLSGRLNLQGGHIYAVQIFALSSSVLAASGTAYTSGNVDSTLTFSKNYAVKIEGIPATEPPDISWEDQGPNSADSQKVKVFKPNGTYVYWRVSTSEGAGTNTTTLLSNSTDFWIDRNVHDEQNVRYKVEVLDHFLNTWPESDWSTTLSIGDRTPPPPPSEPTVSWQDQGPNSCDTQSVMISGSYPTGATKLKFFLDADGITYTYGQAETTSHEFNNIGDGQVVSGYLRAYDNEDNESDPSPNAACIIGDRTPPSPDPMIWESEPYATGSSSISMVATEASDAVSWPVYYQFDFYDSPTEGTGGTDSGWQTSRTYPDNGLEGNHQYGYRVCARDISQNTTSYSPIRYVYTLANPAGTAPFSNVTQNSIQANWTANGNPSGTQYWCENVTRVTNSGWTSSTYWNETGLEPETEYYYRVTAKNGDDEETTPTDLGSETTLPSVPSVIYVDDDAPADPGHGNPDVSDPLEDGSQAHPFDAIQEAIDTASNGQTIIVLDGIYVGSGNRDIDFEGKVLTVQSENGPESCIIDCQGTEAEPHRGFNFHNGEDEMSVIDGLTITNGCATENGGGILCYRSSPMIRNCVLNSNAAPGYNNWGGGICNWGGNPTLRNCTFSGNSAYHGGGMFNSIWSGSQTLTNCTFSGNSAEWGGGIYNWGSNPGINPTLTNCIFSKNSAVSGGGGMRNYDKGSPNLTNCIFNGNSAVFGGAIQNYSESSPNLTNCIFSGNSAIAGCAIWNGERCYSTFTNCTFTNNTSDHGGGGYSFTMYNFSITSVTVDNCIFWGNNDFQIGLELNSHLSISYSNVEGGRSAISVGSYATLEWGDGNISADPCFVDPGYWDPNGTPDDANDDFWVDGDYHLKSQAGRWDPHSESWVQDDVTSPCIDAGNPGSPLGDEPASPNNVRINIGAYGGTAEASKTPAGWGILADLTNDGLVNFEDFAAQTTKEQWKKAASDQPGDLNRNGEVNFGDVKLLAEDWLKQTTWYGL